MFAGVVENMCTYVNPNAPNSVGLTMDVADMAAFEAVLESEAGAAAMKHDGVRPETIVLLIDRCCADKGRPADTRESGP